MDKIIKEIKQYYNKMTIILSAVYFFLSIIILLCSNHGKNIGLLFIAGVMIVLLAITPIYYNEVDYRISNWGGIYVARKICKAYRNDELKKYDSLKIALHNYNVRELKALRLKLKVNRENDKKYGMAVSLPMYIASATLLTTLIPGNADLKEYTDFIFLMLLVVLLVIGLVLYKSTLFYNTDDYIFFCIDEIMEDKK